MSRPAIVSNGRRRLWQLLGTLLFVLTLPRVSEAAYGYTDLWYNAANGKLSGYTLTVLDWWDAPGQFYHEPCECYVTYVYSVELDAALFDPNNQIHIAVPPLYAGYEVVVELVEWSPPMIGTWTAVGFHYRWIDYYIGQNWVAEQRETLGGSSRAAYAACLVPTGETTMSLGWKGDPWPTLHDFRGRLLSSNPAVNFAGTVVVESQPSAGSDQCFASGMPSSWKWALSGLTATANTSNAWNEDTIAAVIDSGLSSVSRQSRSSDAVQHFAATGYEAGAAELLDVASVQVALGRDRDRDEYVHDAPRQYREDSDMASHSDGATVERDRSLSRCGVWRRQLLGG